jgi:hypothetical protein
MPGIPKLNLGNVASGGGWAVGEKYAYVPPKVQQEKEPQPAFKVAPSPPVEAAPRHSSDDDDDDCPPPPGAGGPTPPPNSSTSPGMIAAPAPQPAAPSTDLYDDGDNAAAADDDSDATFMVDNKPLRASGSSASKQAGDPNEFSGTGVPPPTSGEPINRPVDELPTLTDDDGDDGDSHVSANRSVQPAEIVSTRELEYPVRAIAIVNGMVWCAAGEGPLTCYSVQGNEFCVRQVIQGVFNIRSICHVPAVTAATTTSAADQQMSPASTSSSKGSGGDSLWCGKDDGKIIVVSLFFEREDGTIPVAHNDAVSRIVSIPGGRVWSMGRDRVLRLWDAATRQNLLRKVLSNEHVPRFLCPVENTKQVWSVCGRVIRCWDWRDGAESRVCRFAPSPLEPFLVSNAPANAGDRIPDAHAGFTAQHELVSLQYHAASGTVWVSMFEVLVILTATTAPASAKSIAASSSTGSASAATGPSAATSVTTLTVRNQYAGMTVPNVAFVGDDLAIVVGRGQDVLEYDGSHDVIALLHVGKTATTKLRLINRGSKIDGVSAVGCHYLGRNSPFAVAAHTTHRQTRCLSLVATRPVESLGSWRIQGHDDVNAGVPPSQQQTQSPSAGVRPPSSFTRDSSHPATSGHATPPGAGSPAQRGSQRLSKQNSSNAPPTGERTTSKSNASIGSRGANRRKSSDDLSRQPTPQTNSPAPLPAAEVDAHLPLEGADAYGDGDSDASFVVHDEPISSLPPVSAAAVGQPRGSRGDNNGAPAAAGVKAPGSPLLARTSTSAALAPPAQPTVSQRPPRPTSASPSRVADSAASSQVAVSASTHMATPTASAAPTSNNNAGGAASHRTSRLPAGQNSGIVAALSAADSTPPDATTSRVSIEAQRFERKLDDVARQMRRMRTNQDRVGDLSHVLGDSLRAAGRLGLTVVPPGEDGPNVAGLPDLTPELEEAIDAKYATPDGRTVAIVLATLEQEVNELTHMVHQRDEDYAALQQQNKTLQQQLATAQAQAATAAAAAASAAPRRGHAISLSGGSRSLNTPAFTPPMLGQANALESGSFAAASGRGAVTADASPTHAAIGAPQTADAFVRALDAQRRHDQHGFNERLHAVERQHRVTMAKLQAMTQGWTRILTHLEIATARQPPPVVLSCADQHQQPASAVVADLFSEEGHALVTPSSSVDEIVRASRTVSNLIRSHILRATEEEADATLGPNGAASADRLTDYIDRLGGDTPVDERAAATAGRRSAKAIDLELGNVVDSSSDDDSARSAPGWKLIVTLATPPIRQAYDFARSLKDNVSFLNVVPATASSDPNANSHASRPLEASTLLLMRAEMFASMCVHEATLVVAEMTGDDWRSIARDVPSDTRVSGDFLDLVTRTVRELDKTSIEVRQSLASTRAAALPFSGDASHDSTQRLSPSDPLLELRRVLAATTLPVGSRNLNGFLGWCGVWCLGFAFHLAHVLRTIESDPAGEEALGQLNAVSNRFGPLNELERSVRFCLDFYDPSHGTHSHEDNAAADDPGTAKMRRASANPFAAWIHQKPDDASEYLRNIDSTGGDVESQFEIILAVLGQLRERARALVEIGDAIVQGDAKSVEGRATQLRRDLAALQVRTKRLNASLNPASPIHSYDPSPLPHPAGPAPGGLADPASPVVMPMLPEAAVNDSPAAGSDAAENIGGVRQTPQDVAELTLDGSPARQDLLGRSLSATDASVFSSPAMAPLSV